MFFVGFLSFEIRSGFPVVLLRLTVGIVDEGICDITACVREHEDEFVQATMHKSQEEMRKSQREARKILEASEARIHKLDGIIQRLYEDNVEGEITDKGFRKLDAGCEEELLLCC